MHLMLTVVVKEKQRVKKHETQKTKSKRQRCKSKHINNNIESEWIRQFKQKVVIIRLDLK